MKQRYEDKITENLITLSLLHPYSQSSPTLQKQIDKQAQHRTSTQELLIVAIDNITILLPSKKASYIAAKKTFFIHC
jgi:hypothetical protein